MMKMTDMVFDTLLCSPFNHPVQLIAQEYFIKIYTAVFWIMTPLYVDNNILEKQDAPILTADDGNSRHI